MILDETNIQTIIIVLNKHRPPLEPEVQEYLMSYLRDIECDDVDDDAILWSILEQFLGDDECQSILELLSKAPAMVQPKSSLVVETKKLSSASSKVTRPITPPKKSAETTSLSKSKKELRQERRQHKREKGKKVAPQVQPPQDSTSTMIDDHASAWQDCQEAGELWGGRGAGGRGVKSYGDNLQNLHLPSVSLQFEGNELLVDSPMDILQGHRYGLLGRNGVGKSTLLRQLARHKIPGMPRNLRILLVQQQIQGRQDQTTLEALVEADTDRTSLLQKQEHVEAQLEAGVELEENAQRLGDIMAELDTLDADGAEDRALQILKGLSFTKNMIHGPTENLSGGWRMRLALAQALFVPHSDLILLDECTNHLDLHGMDWLMRYLTRNNQKHTLMVVSHDRTFLDAICTDIVVMEHQRLTYHMGNYSEYQRQIQDKASREAQILDASERQRTKAITFVQKQQSNKKSTDPNKQRQAKMIKEKKMDRIGNYREDGKRYKLMSLKKLDESYLRLAQKVHIERDDRVLKLRFPNPNWPPGVSETSPLVRLDNASFGYDPSGPFLLKDMTIHLTRGSKVALVGLNGCGKTTLVKLITDELDRVGKTSGDLWKHPSLRIGHVTQYSVEELEEYSHMTVVEYTEEKLVSGKASSTVIKEASGNVRQYLGAFGLGGAHAHRPIGKLSGGERMRLCFATVLADEPLMRFLDESTNHVDLETLDSMAAALKAFQGAVLMVSHNQGFLSGFCNELWVLEDGHVSVSHDDTETFDELFSQYRSHILSSSAASSRSYERHVKSEMAKRAHKQSAIAKKNTTLLA